MTDVLDAPSSDTEPGIATTDAGDFAPLPLETANALVADNCKLALTAVKKARIPTRRLELEDQIQIALLGMVDGSRRFDPSRGKFSTFAVTCAFNELRHWKTNQSRQCRRGKPISLGDIGAARGRDYELADYRSQAFADLDDREAWKNAMLLLNEQEKQVIEQRFRHGKTLAQIGKLLRVSGERVRQIEAAALKWVRAAIAAAEKERAAKERRRAIEELLGLLPDVDLTSSPAAALTPEAPHA